MLSMAARSEMAPPLWKNFPKILPLLLMRTVALSLQITVLPPPSSAEVHVLDSQGLVLPNTPHADEVLADLFASNDDVNDDGHEGDEGEFSTADDDDEQLETDEEDSETEDPDTATEASTTPSLTENTALAAVFKKTLKNVKKRLGDRLPQRGGSDPGPPARKAIRPALVTSRKAGPK